jgi:hypothetical protein
MDIMYLLFTWALNTPKRFSEVIQNITMTKFALADENIQ